MFFVSLGFKERELGEESKSWRTAEGVILEAHIDASVSRDRNSNDRTKETTTYAPKIKYFYEANGAEYTNTRIRFAAIGSSDRSLSEDLLKKFPFSITQLRPCGFAMWLCNITVPCGSARRLGHVIFDRDRKIMKLSQNEILKHDFFLLRAPPGSVIDFETNEMGVGGQASLSH